MGNGIINPDKTVMQAIYTSLLEIQLICARAIQKHTSEFPWQREGKTFTKEYWEANLKTFAERAAQIKSLL